jgi:hypothetical protein
MKSKIATKISSIPILWILVSAFLVRLAFVVVFAIAADWQNYGSLEGDDISLVGVDGYIQIARTLLTSGEYAFAPGEEPVPFRPPMVPLLMTVFGAWSADYWHWVWLGYSVMAGTATVWVLGKCAAKLEMSDFLTRVMLIAAAFHPYLVFSTRVPALPVTLTLLCTLVIFATIRFVQSGARKPLGLGVTWGMAALTHGSFLPLTIPFFAALLLITKGDWLCRLRGVAIAALLCLVVVAPWTARNIATFGVPIPISTGSGLQYWLGDAIYIQGEKNIPGAFARVSRQFEETHGRELVIEHGGVISLDDDGELARAAKSQLLNDPLIGIRRIIVGLPLFWITMDSGWKKAAVVALLNAPFVLAFCVLTVVLVAKSKGNRVWFSCCVFLLGYWSLFALVQAVGPYFVSVIPCLLLLLMSGFGLLIRKEYAKV